MLDSFELEGIETEKPQKHSAYDRVKDILLPGLSTVATITVALLGRQASVIWALVTLTLVLVVVSFYPALKARRRRRAELAENELIARRYFPKLRRFVHRYGAFVDTRTNDILHSIIATNLSDPSRSELIKRLGTPNISLWYNFWHFFMQRIDRLQPSFLELQSSVSEFHHMVAEYNNFCVAPIFEYLSPELRSGLTAADKSTLNGFQQNFAHFIDDYTAFAKELSESRPSLQRLPHYLPRPKPL